MKRSTRAIFFFFLLLLVSGCKKEEANPEILDPIWSDLEARAGSAEKNLAEEKKKQDGLTISITRAEPNSIDLKNARSDLEKSKRAALNFDQLARYYRIRADRRKIVDKMSYKEAFAKNLPWPDPREYSDYQLNMRLNAVSLNWSSHLPKLQGRVEKTTAKPEKQGESETKPKE